MKIKLVNKYNNKITKTFLNKADMVEYIYLNSYRFSDIFNEKDYQNLNFSINELVNDFFADYKLEK